jgi:hypothetical protein
MANPGGYLPLIEVVFIKKAGPVTGAGFASFGNARGY